MKSLLLLLAILPLAAKPQLHEFKTRASELDSKVKEYPEIGFLIKDKKGKAQDTQEKRQAEHKRSSKRKKEGGQEGTQASKPTRLPIYI